MQIRKNVKLAKHTTFHVGGPAKFFAEVKSIGELKKAADFAKKNNLRIFVLGGGSNTLIADKGINGLVIKMNIKGIKIDDPSLYAGAGEEWDKIVARAVSRGLGGIENLSLIPGTVGGAVYQNIGAYGAEIKDILEFVDVFDAKSGEIRKISVQECRFGYRTSIFQKPESRDNVILGVSLKLSKNSPLNIEYPDLIKYFEGESPSIKEVRSAIIKIRKSKLVYPSSNIGTVGSFFKNPVISKIDFNKLVANFPDIRGHISSGDMIKLSAGQLIEKAGWKGKRLKNVGVSAKHALVLVSYKGAKAKDLLNLAEQIQESVKTKFNIRLEQEVQVVVQ